MNRGANNRSHLDNIPKRFHCKCIILTSHTSVLLIEHLRHHERVVVLSVVVWHLGISSSFAF